MPCPVRSLLMKQSPVDGDVMLQSTVILSPAEIVKSLALLRMAWSQSVKAL